MITPVLEDHYGPLHGQVLEVLDPAGRPHQLGQIPLDRFGELGPRRARTDIDQHGDPSYPFIQRATDPLIRDAITARIDGIDNRVLVLVGEPMTGKSRTLLETLRATPTLTAGQLLCPRTQADFHKLTGITPTGR